MRDTSYKVHNFTQGNFPYFGLWVSELRIAEEGRRDKERQKLQSTLGRTRRQREREVTKYIPFTQNFVFS